MVANNEEAEECTSCGGVGCGICRLSKGTLDAHVAQFPRDKEALLCCYFPIREAVVDVLCNLPELRQALSVSDALFVDLGCGDGCVVIQIVSQVGCRGYGIELDEELVAVATKHSLEEVESSKLDRIKFDRADFRHVDITDATVVFMFLPLHICDYVMREVLPEASLKTGTLVIACGRQDWKPTAKLDGNSPCYSRLSTHVCDDKAHNTLYLFKWHG